jgi:hypothetical protein
MKIVKKSQRDKAAFGTTVDNRDKPTVADVVDKFNVVRNQDAHIQSWFKKKAKKKSGVNLKKKSNA